MAQNDYANYGNNLLELPDFRTPLPNIDTNQFLAGAGGDAQSAQGSYSEGIFGFDPSTYNQPNMASGGPPAADPNKYLNSTFGKINTGLQTMGSLATAWSGLKGLDLGRKQYRFQKGVTNRNVTEQAKSANRSLREHYLAKMGANPNAAKDYGTLEEYMGKYGANEKAIG